MDEIFHGHNPAEGQELPGAVTRVDTRLTAAGRTHGPFRLHYTDTVLNTGNGRLWADWAVTGLDRGVLALPYIGWLSQRQRLPVKFGWLELGLEGAGGPVVPYRVSSWYEAHAIPVSLFQGGSWQIQAWGATLPGESRLRVQLRLTGLAGTTLVLRGATTLGEEAGSPFDAVNGTVGDCAPLPSVLTTAAHDHGFIIRNEPAGLAAELRASGPGAGESTTGQVQVGGLERPVIRQQVAFELRCPVSGQDPTEWWFELELSELPRAARGGPPAALSLEQARAAWQAPWRCLDTLSTPDAQLTAGLQRAAIYSASMLAELDATGGAAGLCDHIEWPVDCARDTFHVASALLLLRPELARRHLAFTFLEAIPAAGAGKSYVATGHSRGHREARLLDLAAYPLVELWRYWRATDDSAFVGQAAVRDTALGVVDQVAGWRDARTGLLTSTERSSDERCVFPCFIPGNAMFAAALEQTAELCEELWGDPARGSSLRATAAAVRQAIRDHAVVDDPEFGPVFAFELGGPGEFLLYDQADLPNLLSLARYGCCAADDPVYRNTVRFAFSRRNQGFRGTADGKYRQLCDGSKTRPDSPWPLGALGQLMSGTATPAEAAGLLDWLRDALTPALQLPEICDKHTARPTQRYWFGWPTGMLMMAFVETICGVQLGAQVRVEPLVPAGWQRFSSPRLNVRGHEVLVVVEGGQATVRLDGETVPAGELPL